MKLSLGKGKSETSNVFCLNKGVSFYGYRNVVHSGRSGERYSSHGGKTWRFGLFHHFDLLFTIIRAVFWKTCTDLLRLRKAVYSYTHIQTRKDLRILEWVATPSSRGSSRPRIEPASLRPPALAGRLFTTSAIWEAHCYMAISYINVCLLSQSVVSDSLRPHGP